MQGESGERSGPVLLAELIHLLHQGAAAEHFFALTATVEKLDLPVTERSSLIECARMGMAIRNRLELQQQRERGLLAVIDSARDLSSHLDLTSLLRATVNKARTLLGAHVAWLSVYNPEADQMQVRVSDGAVFGETDRMTTKKGFGAGSVIFATKMPYTTSDYLSDTRFEHDPKLDIVFRNEGVAALVGVPLLLEDEVIGLLFVADRYHRSHTALEISILSTLATHAAVAMNTAKAFDVARQALQKAADVREALERHARNVQTASEAHERLTGLLAGGATLPVICDALAHLLAGSVLVLDEAQQVICRGDADGVAIGGRDSSVGDNRSAIQRAVHESRRAGRSTVAYKNAHETCWVMSVTSGQEAVGSVVLCAPIDADKDEVALHIFERSASVVGIVLLSQERSEFHRSRDSAALTRRLLLPQQYESASTTERADQIGLDIDKPLTLLLVESGALEAAYLARQIRASPPLRGAVLDEMDDAVAIICKSTDAQGIVQACTHLLTHRLAVDHLGVLSNPVPKDRLPALYSSLRRALLVAKRLGAQGILKQAELALYSVLFETQDEGSINAFLTSSIGGVLTYDTERKSQLATTLLCYFEASRNARLVAKRLNIHVNTVRQRLATVERLLGRLSPARELEVHIALRIWTLKQAANPNP